MSSRRSSYALALAGGALMAIGSIGWLAIFLLNAPGDTVLQRSRAFLDPLAADLSLYLLAAGLFGVFYATRTLVKRAPESHLCFWVSCALLAWLAIQVVVGGRLLLVLHLLPFAFVLYSAWPVKRWDAA